MICGETTEFVRLQSRTGVALDYAQVSGHHGFLREVVVVLFPTAVGFEGGWLWLAFNRHQIYQDGRVVELPDITLREQRKWRDVLPRLCNSHGLCVTGVAVVYKTEDGQIVRSEE